LLLALIPLALAAPEVQDPYKWHPAQPIVDPESTDSKIINGQPAELGQFPWLAVFEIVGGGLCTSSLIRENWILTAGHCIGGAAYDITLGAINRANPGPQAVTIRSPDAFRHPDYNGVLVKNDIALVRLPEPAPLSEYIQITPLALTEDDNPLPGEAVTVTGWGKTADNEGAAINLQYNEQPTIMGFEECSKPYGSSIQPGVICIDGSNGGTCNGDSGGPLNYPQGDGTYVQVGLTSFGPSTGCETGLPLVFTRVSEYADWIEETIAANP